MEKVTLEDIIDPKLDRKIANAPKDIPGWGMDADPENDPTYPIKRWNGADHERINYERAPQQPVEVEILQSNERPTITRVFGTSTPPKGLSGSIRRYAFKHSEGRATHWMTLILADRVDVIQGIVEDLKKGIVPNLFAEWGWKAEWKHNRKKFVTRVATKVLAVAAVVWILSGSKKRVSR